MSRLSRRVDMGHEAKLPRCHTPPRQATEPLGLLQPYSHSRGLLRAHLAKTRRGGGASGGGRLAIAVPRGRPRTSRRRDTSCSWCTRTPRPRRCTPPPARCSSGRPRLRASRDSSPAERSRTTASADPLEEGVSMRPHRAITGGEVATLSSRVGAVFTGQVGRAYTPLRPRARRSGTATSGGGASTTTSPGGVPSGPASPAATMVEHMQRAKELRRANGARRMGGVMRAFGCHRVCPVTDAQRGSAHRGVAA